jgi:putative ABC transport system permease protein
MAILSLCIAVVIAYFTLPLFNNVSGKQMKLQSLFSPLVLSLLLSLPLLVGIVAGSYPAFYLSFFRPIEVLKGKLSAGGNRKLRSALVVFQFATAIILIIVTFVVYSQLNYIQSKDLGYSKDQVLVVDDAYALNKNIDAFKEEMLQQPGVVSGTISSFLPVSNSSRNDNSFSKEGVADAKNGFNMQTWGVDYDYLKTMGMELVKGRNFSKEFGTDSSAVIINEATAKFLGYDDPIGKKIFSLDTKPTAYNIIGVVKNFNFESLHKLVGPLGLFANRSTGLVSFKVKAANIPSVLKAAETRWKEMAPAMPFSYRFLDDSFAEMYKGEQRAGRIALIFSALAIFIACLGLFGLSTFIAEQRTKEIGIRKVLGASVNGIVQLLSKDFIILVAISFVIAAPVAWWAMNKWLEDFAYRITVNWWIFLVAGFCALFIALLTVSFQAVKAALTNPVKNLRTE